MSLISFLAVFLIVWWIMLFLSLPVGLHSQDDEGDVTLGTTSSAPRGRHMGRAFLRATVLTLIVMGVLYGLTRGLGLGFDDIPNMVPGLD